MATIDNQFFNLTGLTIADTHILQQSHVPGTSKNPINDLGYSGLQLRIKGQETTQAAYDDVIAAFMQEGEIDLVIDSGWKFKVHGARHTRKRAIGHSGHYPYDLTVITDSPFLHTTSLTTRSKSITTNSQQWSADDSSNSVTTSGNVAAAPDVQITGGSAGDYDREGILTDETDTTEYTCSSSSYVLLKSETFEATANTVWQLQEATCMLYGTGGYISDCKIAYSINGAADVDVDVDNTSTSVSVGSTSLSAETGANESLVIKFYGKYRNASYKGHLDDCHWKVQELKKAVIQDAEVFNTADEDTVCAVANWIFPEEVVKICADGTGHIDYDDDFTDQKYLDALYDSDGLTYDAVNDELDIADDGYIIFGIDTKYPVTGIPTLTAQIDITAGTPTIQVALDSNGSPGTWYDIDDAIVDDTDTEYELISGSDVNFKGETKIWFRIDCGGTGTVTCTIKSFELDIDIITIDAQMPVISTGGANTFQCNQSSDSSLSCTVALIYEDRKWA
ncbi:hypothetical protein [Methanococcoides sp. FTZ1]|uniref:hypothetical protein n=1 Tax=Methanococcoides sp. FTZ1 TaxID=3439061 RepID=UPI003F860DB1